VKKLAALALVSGALAIAPSAHADAASPDGVPGCDNQYVFTNYATKIDHIGRVGSPVSSYFGAGGTQQFSAGFSGSVSESVSASVSASAKLAIFAEVSASIDGTVQHTQSVSLNVTETQPVGVGRWGNGIYGRMRIVVTGDSVKLTAPVCAHADQHRVTYYVSGGDKPLGWCKWTSTTSMGQRPAQCDDRSPFIP
jgi:hypothetical protein